MALFFVLFKLFITLLIIGLFLYSKLLPYKDKLLGNYKNYFNFFDRIFFPIFKFLKARIKPFQVGQGLSVDMSQIIVLIILLILFNMF